VGFVEGPAAAVALEELTGVAGSPRPPAPGQKDPAVRTVNASFTTSTQLVPCDARDPRQQWSGPGLSAGKTGRIEHVAAGGCLSMAVDAPGQKGIGPCEAATEWTYMAPHVDELSTAHGMQCLDVDGGAPGGLVYLWRACHAPADPDAAHQQWLVVNGTQLQNKATGQCLAVTANHALAIATAKNSSGATNFALCYGETAADATACAQDALVGLDVAQVIAARNRYILETLPPLSDPADDRFQRKLLSTMKVNSMSPDGALAHSWSTTCRAPHKVWPRTLT
jgi:hypothetical protein